MLKRLSSMFVIVAVLAVCCGPAWAAGQTSTATKPSGISVAPVLEQLSLVSGQDQADFTVQVTNNTAYPVQIKLGFADFKALNESGGIAFLGENATSLEQSHGLANWVRLDTQQVGLDVGASAKAVVHLYNLLSLSPGGHYGAVTYQVLKAGPGGPGNRVSINQVLTSLVFVNTAGGGTQRLSMPPPQVAGVQYSIPSSLNLFFKNDGNTQTTPRGSVTIDRGKGSLPIATGVINTDSALVLPGSTRLLPTPLTTFGRPWWPHEYHVHVLYRTDASGKFSTYNASFLYINPPALVVTAALIIATLFGVRWAMLKVAWLEPLARRLKLHSKRGVWAARKRRK